MKIVHRVLLIAVLIVTISSFVSSAYSETAMDTDYNEYYSTNISILTPILNALLKKGYDIPITDGNAEQADIMKAIRDYRGVNGLPPSDNIDLLLLRSVFNLTVVSMNTKLNATVTSTPVPTPTPFPTLPPTVPQYSSTLQKSASGNMVRYLQIKLADLGYYDGLVTNNFDDETRNAVIEFQKNNRLGVDGVVGKQTWNRLFFETNFNAFQTPPPSLEYTSLNYKNVARNPENYKGVNMKFNGTIVQVQGTRKDGYTLRVATSGNYDNIVYCHTYSDPGYALLENDKVTVYATCMGDYTYETVMGNEITLPYFKIDTVELRK